MTARLVQVVTLWQAKAGERFWMVDAILRGNGELAICSGNQDREWYIIIAEDNIERLRLALAAQAGDISGSVLELLHTVFARSSEAEHPFEDIKRFLDAYDINWTHDCW